MAAKHLSDQELAGACSSTAGAHRVGRGRYWGLALIAGLAIYFLAHVLIRATGSGVLELDEAEQMVTAQWWLAGYSRQPPLYTWLQASVFRIFGADLFALSAVKNTLLFSTYLFTYLSARRLLGDPRLAVLATLSLFLIPEIAWESQRDLSHSVIVTTLAAAGFYVVLRWLESPTLARYLLVGLVFGLGMLAKYNYLIFATALVLTLLTLPEGRARLFDRRIAWSALVAGLLILPHAWWLWRTPTPWANSVDKLDFGGGPWLLAGLGELAFAAVAFLTPLWLVVILVYRRNFVTALARASAQSSPGFPLHRYLFFVFLLLVLLVVLGASAFKERWLLPLLWIVPIYLFALIGTDALDRRRRRAFVATCLIVPPLVMLVMGWRLNGWPFFVSARGDVYPFDVVAEQLRERGFDRGLIVGGDSLVAGNLRYRFPGSMAYYPSLDAGGLACRSGDSLLFAWDATRRAKLPERLRDFAEVRFDLAIAAAQIDYFSGPAMTGTPARVGVALYPHALNEGCAFRGP